MTQCKNCSVSMRENYELWKNSGKVSFTVISKTKQGFYRCRCDGCGHTWRTKSEDAALMFNDPIEYARQRAEIDAIVNKMKSKDNPHMIICAL
jgi:hypothetical protein